MYDRLIILGAGGHGKVIADLASKLGYKNICFADDNATGECVGFPIIGRISDAESLDDGKTDFVMAIGNNEIRKKIAESKNLKWAALVHPSAQKGLNVSIGDGTVVMANAVINPDSKTGRHCIINSGAVVEHDNRLSDYVHVSPGAVLGGNVSIGEATHIGIGATVKNGISVCGGCVIGAGAVIVKNITERGVYIGVPGKGRQR